MPWSSSAQEIANVAFGRSGKLAMAFIIGITTFIAAEKHIF